MTEFAWKGRSAFAEYADALDIDALDILAAMPTETGAHVLYSTGTEDLHAARVWAVVLTRDDAGVLMPSMVRKEILGGMEKLERLIGED